MQRILGGQSGGDAGGTDGEVRSGVDNDNKNDSKQKSKVVGFCGLQQQQQLRVQFFGEDRGHHAHQGRGRETTKVISTDRFEISRQRRARQGERERYKAQQRRTTTSGYLREWFVEQV